MIKRIVVVGSANVDLCVNTDHFPMAGETVLGNEFMINMGGKGANQAVAAARLGGNVSFIGLIGNDDFGKMVSDSLRNENINITFLTKTSDAPTGIAIIIVNNQGENEIVVAAGSNYKLLPHHIDMAEILLSESEIILVQQEIPEETVLYLIKKAKQLNRKVLINLAPARILPEWAFKDLYMILLNETETEYLTGISLITDIDIINAAKYLKDKGISNIIITLGSKGAYLYNDYINCFIQTDAVKAIDTTAAGDTFAGALAIALTQNLFLNEAAIFASKAAAISVTRKGAQMSMPYLHEIN